MISVLRQEWKARKNAIILVSAALFVFTAIGIPLGSFGADSESQVPFYGFFIVLFIISILITTGCVFFLPLLKGAGNIGNELLTDRGYLLLTLPKKPAVLFTGKMIIGLAEFLIYAVPVFFYLTLSMPLIGYIMNTGKETYREIIKKIYYLIFIERLNVTVSIVFTAIAFFVFAQTVLNLVVVLYRSIMRTRKASFLMVIFTLVAIFITLKTAAFLSDIIISPITHKASIPDALWFILIGCFLVFSVIYFVITVFLFEHKVEI